MKSRATNYKVKPSQTPKTATNKKGMIIGISVAVGVFLICALAVGLGVGLGLGLKKNNPPPSSNSSTCNAATATCGCSSTQPSVSTRIVNGSIATANSWPWMVAIYISNGRFCGGTLISSQHVLTAAHCVADVTSNDVIVYAGIQRLSERFNGQIRNLSTIYVHPNYSNSTLVNDLAILKLSSSLNLSTTIGLCCLPTANSRLTIGDYPVYIGWGRTEPTSDFSDELRQSEPEVVNSSFCSYASLTDNQICTGNTSSIACYGDSGSPLMMKINDAWTCMGVVNMGLLTCDSYVVFTRVFPYMSFISNITSL